MEHIFQRFIFYIEVVLTDDSRFPYKCTRRVIFWQVRITNHSLW